MALAPALGDGHRRARIHDPASAETGGDFGGVFREDVLALRLPRVFFREDLLSFAIRSPIAKSSRFFPALI